MADAGYAFDFLNSKGMISLCEKVARETAGYTDREKDDMLDAYISEKGNSLTIDMNEVDRLPLVERMLIANFFYMTVAKRVEGMSKTILFTRLISPFFAFILDNEYSETDINGQVLDEMKNLSCGIISESGKKFLLSWMEGWEKRKRDFNIRLVCAAIIHLDIIGIISMLVIQSLS